MSSRFIPVYPGVMRVATFALVGCLVVAVIQSWTWRQELLEAGAWANEGLCLSRQLAGVEEWGGDLRASVGPRGGNPGMGAGEENGDVGFVSVQLCFEVGDQAGEVLDLFVAGPHLSSREGDLVDRLVVIVGGVGGVLG